MRICPNCHQRTPERHCPDDGFQTVEAALYEQHQAEALVGTVFEGRYRVDRLLGRGGMGSVYQATQLAVGRPVALKVMRQELTRELKEVARFQQEARAVAALSHPNTVRLIDFGQMTGGSLYLVMEFLEGESLTALLSREAPLAPPRAVAIASQALESLAEAHAQGIVHRDLKPENLHLTEVFGREDFVKVLDFGIAKVPSDLGPGTRLTGTGIAMGSPRYIAPEQAKAEAVTPQADVYAMGVILYEMLTARTPFNERSASAFMVAHVQAPPPWPIRDGSPLAGPLVDVVMQCLAKDPQERPRGAAGLLAALRGLEGQTLVERPGQARPPAEAPAETPADRAPSTGTRRLAAGGQRQGASDSGAAVRPPRAPATSARAAAEGAGSSWPEGRATGRAPLPSERWGAPREATTRRTEGASRRAVGAAGAAVVLLVLGAAAAWWWLGGGSGGAAEAAAGPASGDRRVAVAAGATDAHGGAGGVAAPDAAAVEEPPADAGAARAAVEEDLVAVASDPAVGSADAAAVAPLADGVDEPPHGGPAEPAFVDVEVRSRPSRAVVREGRTVLGTTPVTLRLWPGREERTFTLTRTGYRAREVTSSELVVAPDEAIRLAPAPRRTRDAAFEYRRFD